MSIASNVFNVIQFFVDDGEYILMLTIVKEISTGYINANLYCYGDSKTLKVTRQLSITDENIETTIGILNNLLSSIFPILLAEGTNLKKSSILPLVQGWTEIASR